ncbi:MAG TPA: SpoIID/LytB domain-containing protein [Acidimicrobiia bacterium]|nr:SpoIID/LytB domain-containing protein [Acidimicrobiia bacterium]
MRLRKVLLAFVLGVSLLPAVPAVAQTTDPTFTVNGSGWGHMVGMSQYGARAMAEGGFTASQITGYYYANTTVQSIPAVVPAANFIVSDSDPLWIGFLQNRTSFNFRVDGAGSAGLCKANDGEGACPTQFAAAGETWEFRALGGGACQFFKAGTAVGNPGTCQAAITWDFAVGTRIFAIDNGLSYARGVIRIRPVGDGFHVILEIGVEEYLYGLGEMPSSWHSQALHAQAIAARTYGVRQAIRYGPEESFDASRKAACWCQLFSTVVDQAYVGWAKEADQFGPNWVAAVQATAGQVVTHPLAPEYSIIIAYYASSTGGHTDSNVEGLGHTTPLPYLVPTPDPWSLDPAAQNPFASWTVTFTGSQIAAAVGLTTVTGVEVTGRNFSGTVSQVTIAGTLNGQETVITQGGRTFRSALGMRSTMYNIAGGSGVGTAVCDGVAPSAGFTDVGATNPHLNDINCIAALEITTGTAPGIYSPAATVTRWQMAIFLARTAAVLGVALPPGASQGFEDLGGLSVEAVTAINQIRQLGITTGTTATTFDPNGVVSRWQMALFLTRLHPQVGGVLPAGADQGFTDLTGLSPEAITAVNQLAELGITLGTAPGLYSPSNPVAREQMASFLARLIRI